MDFTENNFDKLRKKALRVSNSYIDGFSSVKIIIELLDFSTKSSKKYIENISFYDYLYGISFQSMILNLCNILVEDRNNESLNLHDMISFISIDNFPDCDEYNHLLELHSFISDIVEKYPKSCEFTKSIKELRDKYIAHIDKARFHANVGLKSQTNITEIFNVYGEIGVLVGKFISILEINPELLDFEQLDKANLHFRRLVNKST